MQRIFLMLIMGVIGLAACAGNPTVRTTLIKEHDFTVALEQQQGSETMAPPAPGKSAVVDVAAVQQLLEDLRYGETSGALDDSHARPVFQRSEIDRLAPALANALARDDGRQRVRFISFNQHQATLFSESRKTEGVVFVAPDGRLNIAFNYINAKRLPSESSALYARSSEVDPLRIGSSDTALAPAASYAAPASLATGKPAPLWVVADLDKLRQAAAETASPAGEATAGRVQAEAPGAVVSSRPESIAAPSRAAGDILQQDVKSKLRYLKELVGEGLISEDEYKAKKAELLKKIE